MYVQKQLHYLKQMSTELDIHVLTKKTPCKSRFSQQYVFMKQVLRLFYQQASRLPIPTLTQFCSRTVENKRRVWQTGRNPIIGRTR